MEQRTAHIISYLLHPLLMPVYGIFIISFSGTYAGIADIRVLRYLNMLIFGLTFALPAAFIPLYLYARLIRHAEMKEKRERIIPYGITLVFYLMAYLLVRDAPVSRVYHEFLLSGCITLAVVLVISFFWKISAHMSGLGGVTGLVTGLSVMLEADLMIYLLAAILASGLVAWARLRTGAHDGPQVYSGFILGFVIVLLVFLF